MKYYSMIKINELSSHEKTQRKLKCMLLSEKKASLKRLHTIWFQLFDIPREAQLWRQRKISGFQEPGQGWW